MAFQDESNIIIESNGNVIDAAAFLQKDFEEQLASGGLPFTEFCSLCVDDAGPDVEDALGLADPDNWKSTLTPGEKKQLEEANKAKHVLVKSIEKNVLKVFQEMKTYRNLMIPENAVPFINNLGRLYEEECSRLASPLDRFLQKTNPPDPEKRQWILSALADYVFLLAADLYVREAIGTEYGKLRRGDGVLNRCFRDTVWAYLKPPEGLFSEIRRNAGIPERMIHTRDINDHLQFLQMMDSRGPEGKHNLRFVTLDPEDYGSTLPKTGRLRMGLAVLTGNPATGFPRIPGTTEFTVSHSKEYEKRFRRAVRKILREAAKEHVNILAFPEYMITGELLRVIQSELDKITSAGEWRELLFIVAGTRWTEDNCNRTTVLSRYGTVLGVSDKIAPFETKMKSGKSRIFLKEKLDHPGKEILVLDVRGIGRFMFPICRDVCVREDAGGQPLARYLVDKLQPDMLLVPAWSSSVEGGFEESFREIASSGKTAVLCNCCEAVFVKGKPKINPPEILVGHPRKDPKHPSHITGVSEKLHCEKCKDGICRNDPCMFVLELQVDVQTMTGETDMILSHLHRSDL